MPTSAVGVDMGLESFLTTSDGEMVENPRLLRRSEARLRLLRRRLSRCQRRSKNRAKRRTKIARHYERVAAQRKAFAHQEARKLVSNFDLVAFENLNIKGLARTRLAKSVLDAAWGVFLFLLVAKAESAGRTAIGVNPRGTSQECPACGAVKRKTLSERVHRCPCGCVMDRDVAAAKVILARATRGNGGVKTVEGSASAQATPPGQVGPAKQDAAISRHCRKDSWDHDQLDEARVLVQKFFQWG